MLSLYSHSNLSFLLSFFLFVVLFNSCEKSEPFEVDSGNGNELNQQLVVTITHLYNPIEQKDSLISNVTVKLFLYENSRELGINIEKTGITDSSGQATFHYLREEYYYVKAEHPVVGELLDEVSIPDNAVKSYLDLIYY